MAYSRRNLSCEATFEHYDLENPFASGQFRYVAQGTYVDGPRCNQPCVTKWFKTGAVYEEIFFDKDLQAVEKSQEIIDAYNSSGCINQNIYLNHPGVWTFKPGTRYAGQKTLTEPFINNYQKFNSNTGCVIGGDSWSEVMQSLSHFSYHNSGGQMVLCDLQGGIRSGRRGAVLTDPVILSRRRTYGVTDLGPEGISTFFARHQCNHYCKEHWQKPRNTTVYFKSWGQACRCLGQPARRRSRTNQRFMRIAIMALTKVACGQIERPGRSGGTSEVVVTQLQKA